MVRDLLTKFMDKTMELNYKNTGSRFTYIKNKIIMSHAT